MGQAGRVSVPISMQASLFIVPVTRAARSMHTRTSMESGKVSVAVVGPVPAKTGWRCGGYSGTEDG